MDGPAIGAACLPDNDSPLGAANDHSPSRLPRGPGVFVGAWREPPGPPLASFGSWQDGGDRSNDNDALKLRANEADHRRINAMRQALGLKHPTDVQRFALELTRRVLLSDPEGIRALLAGEDRRGFRWQGDPDAA